MIKMTNKRDTCGCVCNFNAFNGQCDNELYI